MPDGETSSGHPAIETLEEQLRLWDEGPEQARNSIRVNVGTLREAVGYAAQLEAMLAYACGEPDLLDLLHEIGEDSTRARPGLVEDACLAARVAILEARADRDQLHDALQDAVEDVRALEEEAPDDVSHEGHTYRYERALEEVEAGGTLDRIREEARREAIEEAATMSVWRGNVDPDDYGYSFRDGMEYARDCIDALAEESGDEEGLQISASQKDSLFVVGRGSGSFHGVGAGVDVLGMSQAIYFALRCDECDIGGEHRAMLERHAELYEALAGGGDQEDNHDA